jgi:hypothetical protein
MLFLCFYANGPRADNLVRLPAFPSGCSYDRPFRYRDKWIDSTLLEDLRADSHKHDGADVVVGLRFIGEKVSDALIPLRRGRLLATSLSPDQNQFYFRVDRLYQFANATDLGDAALQIPTTVAEAKRGLLFFDLEGLDVPDALDTDEQEDGSWTRLTELIGKSSSLPVHDDARRAVYLRLQRPRRRRFAKPKKIHHSWTVGDIYGFRLPEQSPYEIAVLHRIPALIGTDTSLTERPELKFAGESAAISVAPSSSEISANYDKHVVAISGERKTGSWVELQIRPEPSKFTAGEQELVAYPISLPLRVRIAPLYRLRTQIVPILLVAGALFASSYYTIYKDTHNDNVPFWPSLLASFLASLVIFLFKK